MKFVRHHLYSTQICSAFIALSAVAMAEEHPDDVSSKTPVEADASDSDGERETAASAAEADAPEPGRSEVGGPPSGGPPGGPPGGGPPEGPGGPPGGGPPGGPGGPPGEGPPGMMIGPPLRVGLASRVDVGLGGNRLDDPYSTALIGVGARGNVLGPFSVTTLLNASYDARDASGQVTLLDGFIQFEPTEALNLWLGRMIIAVDRSALAGPPFMAAWIYTGLGYVDGQLPLPRAGFLGRGDGVTLWGSLFGGHLKYYASAVDLVVPGESPLVSGRVSLALLEPEPGYFAPTGYFGRDILSIGVGGQSKKDGSVNPITQARADFTEYNVDLLFEKNLGSAGVINLEGAYYKFSGDFERTDESWFGLASYVLPFQIAGARLQPLVRMQQAVPTAPGAPTSTIVDGQLSIILNGHFARLALGYRRSYAGIYDVPGLYMGVSLFRL